MRCCLDDSLLRLADRILLRLIVAMTAPRRGAAAESGNHNDVNACNRHRHVFIEREDREGNKGSCVATEDDDNTDAEAGVYARDFLEVVLRRLWEGHFRRRRTTTKTTETSRDDEHKEDAVPRLMFETLCEGEPLLSLSTARPKR